jgi:thiosulfate/3-mercaptopyruvate sulfurtransferase
MESLLAALRKPPSQISKPLRHSSPGTTAMKSIQTKIHIMFALALILLNPVTAALAAGKPATSIPTADLIQPAELAADLTSASLPKPLILQVGFRNLYLQAHIPNSEYIGAAREEAGIKQLRDRVTKLSTDSAIVIYCGCCPWSRCPNVAAAYDTLHALGFTHVKVLYIAENFGDNWVNQGYPVAKDE